MTFTIFTKSFLNLFHLWYKANVQYFNTEWCYQILITTNVDPHKTKSVEKSCLKSVSSTLQTVKYTHGETWAFPLKNTQTEEENKNIVCITDITIVNCGWIFFPSGHKGIESSCAISDFMGQKVKQFWWNAFMSESCLRRQGGGCIPVSNTGIDIIHRYYLVFV